MELGVNHYLGKPYSEDELLRLVRQYCAVQTAVDGLKMAFCADALLAQQLLKK